MLGVSRSQLTNTLRLLKVHERVRQGLAQKMISEGHAKVLAGLPLEEQPFFCQQVEKKHLSVRQLEDMIAQSAKQTDTPAFTRSPDPYSEKIERSLEEIFLTKIDFSDNGKGRGKIVLYYNSYDELSGILNKTSVETDVF